MQLCSTVPVFKQSTSLPVSALFFSVPSSTCSLYFVHFYHYLMQAILPLVVFRFLTKKNVSNPKFLKKKKKDMLPFMLPMGNNIGLNSNEFIKHQQSQCRLNLKELKSQGQSHPADLYVKSDQGQGRKRREMSQNGEKKELQTLYFTWSLTQAICLQNIYHTSGS